MHVRGGAVGSTRRIRNINIICSCKSIFANSISVCVVHVVNIFLVVAVGYLMCRYI